MNLNINPNFTHTVATDRRRAFAHEADMRHLRRLVGRHQHEVAGSTCQVLLYDPNQRRGQAIRSELAVSAPSAPRLAACSDVA